VLKPTIHLNGTNGEELLKACRDAGEAIHEAVGRVLAMAPNGRDYYPQGPGALKIASDGHRAMIQSLEAVLAEVDALAIEISDENGKRER